MGEGRTSNVIKNSVASLIFKVVSMLIQFAIRTVFIYCLGKEYTGISGLFTDILTVLSVMELGLDTSMVYSMYKPIAQKDTRKVAILMGVYRKMFTVIGILLMVSGVLCVPFLEYIVKGVPNIKEDIRLIFLAYVATSAVSYFLIYKTLIFRADQKSRVISNISMMVQIVECVAEIILIIIFKEFVAYLLVHFVATFLRNYILAKKAEKEYPEWFRKTDEKLDKAELRTLWRDMACIGVYNISGVVINSTDSIFISAFIGTVEVAIIGNFTMIIKSVRTTVEQIVGSAKASIGNLAATSTKEKQEAVFQQMNFLAFWVAAFCCTCLFVLLNPFIGDIWFDSTYETSMPIIAVLVINFFIAVMVYPVESFRTANGLFVQGWLRPAIMALLNIILDFFLDGDMAFWEFLLQRQFPEC